MTDMGNGAIDEELGRRLRAAAPGHDDTGAALDALRPRLHRARRRRRGAIAAAAALGATALISLGVLVINPGGGGDVRTPPATRPDAPVTTTVPGVTSDPTPSTGIPGATAPGATTATTDDHGGSSGPGGAGGSGSSGSGSGSSGSSGHD